MSEDTNKPNPMNIMTAFPVHVGSKQWKNTEKLNEALTREIHKKQGADPDGIYRSNAAGTWHSDDYVLNWTGEAGQKLSQMFGHSFRTYIDNVFRSDPDADCKIRLQAWAMVYGKGGYATVHTHPNCHLSGVYYVDSGEEQELTMATGVKIHPGDIEFVDPGIPQHFQYAGMQVQRGFRIQPRAGQMLVFPSGLQHFVHPVGAEERISIACNATIVKYKLSEQEKTPDDPK